jgi:hypothetical protein
VAEGKREFIRAVWNGPFYVGPLSRPVSVGDVILIALETLWRGILLIVGVVVASLGCILAWTEVLEPNLFPPLKTQISAAVSYDDGSTNLPAIGKPFRCSAEFPLKIALSNKSQRTVGSINFSIEGRAAGRSSNVVRSAALLESDKVIAPGYTWQSCWPVSVQEGYDPAGLNYQVEVWGATETETKARYQPAASPSGVTQKPRLATEASAPPKSRVSAAVSLGTIDDTDWQKIGMGCACSFTTGAPRNERLIAGGDGRTFFRLNGKERLCPAPDTQAMFDGPVAVSCGPTAVQVTPYGKVDPGFDGHSSKARLHIADSAGTLSLTGTWGCGC